MASKGNAMGTHLLSCNDGTHVGRTQNPDTLFFSFFYLSCKRKYLHIINWKRIGENIGWLKRQNSISNLLVLSSSSDPLTALPFACQYLFNSSNFPSPTTVFMFKMAILRNVRAETFQVSTFFRYFTVLSRFTMFIKI